MFVVTLLWCIGLNKQTNPLCLPADEKNCLSDCADGFENLAKSCDKFRLALNNFIEMYYNEHLSRLLRDMQKQSEVCGWFSPMRVCTAYVLI